MSLDEKTTFGAIVPPVNETETHLLSPPKLHIPTTVNSDTDSVMTLTPTASRVATPQEGSSPLNPFSAFYSHPATRHSLEEARTASKTHFQVYETDLEAGLSTADLPKQSSLDGNAKECTMWPSKKTLREKAKLQEKATRRMYNPMRNLSKKQKLYAKILIALLVVAAAVGIGIGVSRAVGGGVWAGNNTAKKIPADNN
ncbi:hypothetical protein B0A49_08544 [Cryomyces minteri]|uniref:Uncharacterized protein n=1 Tax=Cryomyces minteri TaxID=331657 RepID=A0A4U0X2C2_9PEZI|nr:hypothetical protein B0A49_08296 [Cryomyces minteri]TKA68435.1 hypothetical protein B0A49_08544 [Cryomyces minteri]